jgi:hypothetical protein
MTGLLGQQETPMTGRCAHASFDQEGVMTSKHYGGKRGFAGDAYREDDVCAGSWRMFRFLWLLNNVEDKKKGKVLSHTAHAKPEAQATSQTDLGTHMRAIPFCVRLIF